jgi:hypothetical protein
MENIALWDVTSCSMVDICLILEEPTAYFFFCPQGEGCKEISTDSMPKHPRRQYSSVSLVLCDI